MGRRSRMYYDGVQPEDLPYGPGNPDYEYDGWRQRKDEEAEEEKPDEAEAKL